MLGNALIIVDVQNDFCKGGALEVPNANQIIPLINREMRLHDLVLATKDWHPKNHGSFASQHPGKKPFDEGVLGGQPQMFWPDHCIQATRGAELHQGLNSKLIHRSITKGEDPKVDSYSGFVDNCGKNRTRLFNSLEIGSQLCIGHVFICGLATDNCVKFTALDAVKFGFTTFVLKDLCRAVDVASLPDVYEELDEAGVVII